MTDILNDISRIDSFFQARALQTPSLGGWSTPAVSIVCALFFLGVQPAVDFLVHGGLVLASHEAKRLRQFQVGLLVPRAILQYVAEGGDGQIVTLPDHLQVT